MDIFVKTIKEIAEYVGRTFKKGSNIRLAIENLSLPARPYRKTQPATRARLSLKSGWEKEVDEYVKCKTYYLADNMQRVYSLVWGQCTYVMRQKLKVLPTYKQLTTGGDQLGFLKPIKNLVYNFQSQKYLSRDLHKLKRWFYFCTQRRHHTTTSAYMEKL
jgi:hypothetical protein